MTKTLLALILLSSISFIGYGIAYFVSPGMKIEFQRFGLEKVGALTAVLELLGGIGLIVGLKYNPILLFSSAGLGILMLLGVAVRIKMGDGLLISLPATFFMLLNFYIFYLAFQTSR